MAGETEDDELAAIKTLLDVLAPLKPDSRSNVIDYVFRRLGIAIPMVATPVQLAAPPPASPSDPHSIAIRSPPSDASTDLRSLKEQKLPRSANQMVAIVAYYLANLAPTEQRRDYIVADDIKKYFPQANFELPTGPHNMTLVNAKNAGYLDVLGSGQYRLNPVGHNLVTHRLPRVDGSAPGRGPRHMKKVIKKAVKRKKART